MAKAKQTKEVVLTADYDPLKDKDGYMNPVMLEFFRQKLTEWRRDLIRESSETVANTLQETELQKPDLADRASAETDHALELRTRDRERKLVKKINSALRRIDEGEYGYCLKCGEDIAPARLAHSPSVPTCIECAREA